MIEFVHLARLYPEARLVFSGGSGLVQEQDLKEAEVARLLFERLGIDGARVVYEDRSRNTWENAVFSKQLVSPDPDERWLLVTSAIHMPRAVGIFRRIGWPVIPYPVDFALVSEAPPVVSLDLLDGLLLLNAATCEYLGLLAYRLLDRTSALFPAPA